MNNFRIRYILIGIFSPLLLPVVLFWIVKFLELFRTFFTFRDIVFGFEDYLSYVTSLYAALLFGIILVHYSSLLSSKASYYSKLCDSLLSNYEQIQKLIVIDLEATSDDQKRSCQQLLQSQIDSCRVTIKLLNKLANEHKGGGIILDKLKLVEARIKNIQYTAGDLFVSNEYSVKRAKIEEGLYQLKILHMEII